MTAASTASTAQYTAKPISVQLTLPVSQLAKDFTENVLWRIGAMYREIVFLTRLPQNERGGCYAKNRYYMKKYGWGDSTVRAYRAILRKYGCIRSDGRGPNILDVPLVAPEKIVGDVPFFYRLFKRLLPVGFSGFAGRPILIPTDKEENSNTRAHKLRGELKQARVAQKPLPPEAQCVVVSAANAGVSPDAADTLVRTLDPETVRDAVELALWYKASDPQKAADGSWGGGWIRTMATQLKSGAWALPAKFLEHRKRNQAKQKARRDGRAGAAPAIPTASAATFTAMGGAGFAEFMAARAASQVGDGAAGGTS